MDYMSNEVSTVFKLSQDLQFISDSQDVESVQQQFKDTEDYDSFFIKIEDGEYKEVWGMYGIIPYSNYEAFRIK
jgi:hypothetical protein